LREIESAKGQAEQERLRLASENAERRKREDEEEMRRKTLEAQERYTTTQYLTIAYFQNGII
jgi:hypothetical protein